MNKKIVMLIGILVLIIVLILFIFGIKNNNSNNNSNQLKVLCKSKNKSYSCKIYGEVTEYEVSSISITYRKDTLKNIEILDNWLGNGENGSIDLYTDINKSKEFEIASFKSKKEPEKSYFGKIVFYDENFEEHIIKNIKINLE